MNVAEQPEFVNLPGFTAFEPLWAEFSRLHSQWLRERLSENEVVYRLPEKALDLLEANLQLDADDLAAEVVYDRLCLRFKAIGAWNNRPILYRWLLPALAPFPKALIESMTSLGWKPEQLPKVVVMVQIGGDVSERLQSVAGRRICNPLFLDEADRLRSAWRSLADAERPSLPLARTPGFQQIPDCLEGTRTTEALADFLKAFDQFCDRWCLLGMVTWDLPDPDGPKWPEPTRCPQGSRAEALTFRTPVDFPLLNSDRLGEIARDQHAASAERSGITDIKRWETYARLLEIDHWERVLRTRYADAARPRNYVTFLAATIGQVIDLDAERVQEYRKQLRALKSGRRSLLSPRH